MKHYKYLIIGGGLTGDAAVRGIRELDSEGSIGMFSMAATNGSPHLTVAAPAGSHFRISSSRTPSRLRMAPAYKPRGG